MYSDLDLIKALKKARETAGLTQKDVEAELGLRPLTMRDYEVGRLKLPMTVALHLADLYGLSLDQLVGLDSELESFSSEKTMANFSSIFSGISYQVMFLDPILRAYFEDNREQFFDRSIFDVLTLDLSKRQKKELVFEIGKLLFSLAGCDNKITEEEVKTIKHILSLFTLLKSYKELSAFSVEQMSYDNIPQFFRRIEMRHFLIWILFLFAKADGRISGEEINFIEDRAEELKVNKTNFLFIHDHFVKEEF